MDDLVNYCVEEIALDGEQVPITQGLASSYLHCDADNNGLGATLSRLWQFAQDFQSRIQQNDSEVEIIDHSLRVKLWKLLLSHQEIIVKASDRILHNGSNPNDSKTHSTLPVSIGKLDALIEEHGESLLLTTSEDKQWVSMTGFPKEGNQVPNLHFKLLTCISRARKQGVTQVEAAKITGQDPRSLYNRTKRLVELGLITKIPILQNGNNTYTLTHTRFLDSISRDAGSRSWYQYQPLLENEESVETGSQKLMTRRGLSRDRPLAAQIMHVIGNGGWEKRGLFSTLQANNYRIPIESFIEKANLPKPTPTAKTVQRGNTKELKKDTDSGKAVRTKRSQKKPRKSGGAPSSSTTSDGPLSSVSHVSTKTSSPGSLSVLNPQIKKTHDQDAASYIPTSNGKKHKAIQEASNALPFKRLCIKDDKTNNETPSRESAIVDKENLSHFQDESTQQIPNKLPTEHGNDPRDSQSGAVCESVMSEMESSLGDDMPTDMDRGREVELICEDGANLEQKNSIPPPSVTRDLNTERTRLGQSPFAPDTLEVDLAMAKRKRVTFTNDEDILILQAVSLIKAYVDTPKFAWALLKPLIPDRKESSIKRRYQTIEREMKSYTVQFLQMFSERYMDAQRRGEVKPIEKGPNFDLEYYLSWFRMQNLKVPEESQRTAEPPMSLYLPKDLRETYTSLEVELPKEVSPCWLSDYYKREGTSMRRRHEALYSEAFVVRPGKAKMKAHDELADRTESLVKATILTPEALHDKHKAKEWLLRYGNEAVEKTYRSFLEKRLLIKSNSDQPNRRKYRMADKWNLHLRSPFGDGILNEGQAFLEFLSSTFNDNKDLLVSDLANDGSIFCILRLVASQQVILRAAIDGSLASTPIESYRGRAIEKDKLQFEVIVSKAERFNPTQKLSTSKRRPERESEEPQAWITVDGKVIDSQLDLFKAFVHDQVHMRPYITKDELLRTGGGVLTSRECDVLLQSLVEDRVIEKTTSRGYRTL